MDYPKINTTKKDYISNQGKGAGYNDYNYCKNLIPRIVHTLGYIYKKILYANPKEQQNIADKLKQIADILDK